MVFWNHIPRGKCRYTAVQCAAGDCDNLALEVVNAEPCNNPKHTSCRTGVLYALAEKRDATSAEARLEFPVWSKDPSDVFGKPHFCALHINRQPNIATKDREGVVDFWERYGLETTLRKLKEHVAELEKTCGSYIYELQSTMKVFLVEDPYTSPPPTPKEYYIVHLATPGRAPRVEVCRTGPREDGGRTAGDGNSDGDGDEAGVEEN